MEKEKFNELEELARPLVDYIRENYHPHVTVVVTDTFVRVTEDLMGVPFPLED